MASLNRASCVISRLTDTPPECFNVRLENISILWTILLGAVGALIGGAVASFFDVAHTDGIDWIRWALSLVAAIVSISIYLSVTGRK